MNIGYLYGTLSGNIYSELFGNILLCRELKKNLCHREGPEK